MATKEKTKEKDATTTYEDDCYQGKISIHDFPDDFIIVDDHAPSKKRKGITSSSKPVIVASSTKEGEESLKLESKKKKGTREPSWVWKHFTIKEIGGKPMAVCNWCEKTKYACHSKKNGTSNMSNHLNNQCKKFPKQIDPKQKVLSFQPTRKEAGDQIANLGAVAFDQQLSRSALARMIIVDGLKFLFVEGDGFRYFMSVTQPLFHIPSRITCARDCYKLYLTEKEKLKTVVSKNSQHVSLTTDCWTSVQNLNYMCLTTHFIDSEWVYHKRIIGFCCISNHKGETIGKALESQLQEWGIEKVFAVTVDNAAPNDTALVYLKKKVLEWGGSVLDGELLHMRCCAHILNLIVSEGLKEMHDSLIKIRNAVRYVRASPSRSLIFKACIEREKIQSKSSVCLDVPTRWNSTYLMLETSIKFQKAFERLEDTDGMYLMEFSHGENASERKKGPPEFADWEVVGKFVKFFKVFYDATVRISGSTHVTSHLYFHDFCTILNVLNTYSASNDPLFSKVAADMKKKHQKYWGATSNMNVIMFLACVLDPRYKLKFVEFSLEKLYDKVTAVSLCSKVKATLYRMFDEYCVSADIHNEDGGLNVQVSRDKNNGATSEFFAFADLYDKEMSMEAEKERKNEVDVYLAEDREKSSDKFDILNWWKVHSSRYHILSLIARDVLAVPMSTVASESAFSTGGRVLDPYRSSLRPKMVEALICAQNWFRSTPISEDMEDLEIADKIEEEISKLSNEMLEMDL